MKWLLIVPLLVALTVSTVASWHLIHPRTESAAPLADRSTPGHHREVVGVGYVEPVSEMRKLMFRTGGVIGSCPVRAGDVVRKGQLLMELDSTTQKADVELARRLLEQARADAAHINAGINPYRLKVLEQTIERLREKVRHLATEVERYDQLAGQGGVSKQDHEGCKSRLRQAEIELREQEAELLHLHHYVTPENRAAQQAKVHHAEANVRLAEERLGKTTLRAPLRRHHSQAAQAGG
jgi:HlyD family secretion protein